MNRSRGIADGPALKLHLEGHYHRQRRTLRGGLLAKKRQPPESLTLRDGSNAYLTRGRRDIGCRRPPNVYSRTVGLARHLLATYLPVNPEELKTRQSTAREVARENLYRPKNTKTIPPARDVLHWVYPWLVGLPPKGVNSCAT